MATYELTQPREYRGIRAMALKHDFIVKALPILAILGFQVLLSLSLQNSIFQDEALYLYVGRRIFEHVSNDVPFFSGSPYLYPVMAGFLDKVGGLELARMLSLFWMLVSSLMVFHVTRHLFDINSAYFGMAIYAVQGPILFMGRLATYDAMCLALLSMALFFSIISSKTKGVWLGIVTGLILGLAMVTKYAGLLWFPGLLAVTFWFNTQTRGWKKAALLTLMIGAIVAAVIATALYLDPEMLTAIHNTTTNRVVGAQNSTWAVFKLAFDRTVLPIGLVFFGLLVCGFNKNLPTALILFGSALLAPAYHVYKAEVISLQKHIGYGFMFGAPLIGYGMARLGGYIKDRIDIIGNQWALSLVIALLTFSIGYRQAQQFYTEWPDVSQVVTLMKSEIRPNDSRILAEDAEVYRYYFQDRFAEWQWNHLYWFEYTDEAGNYYPSGEAAYEAAIRDGYFDLIALRYGPAKNMAEAIDDSIGASGQYTLIASIPSDTSFGPGETLVWRHNPGATVSNQTEIGEQ